MARRTGQPRKNQGWWHSSPGILTALAAIITALTGLMVALHSVGLVSFKPAAVKANTLPADGTAPPVPSSPPAPVNLLAPENGGHIVRASGDAWQVTTDGKDHGKYIASAPGQEAVYAFRNNGVATFGEFAVLVPEAGDNIRQFELAVANDSPDGPFAPIGRFEVKNVRMEPDGYQVFPFEPHTARYLKLRIVSSYHPSYVWLTEFRLAGRMQDEAKPDQ